MPAMYGLSSGIDTQKIIKDLKKIEQRPVKHLERQKEERSLENKILVELQKMSKNLETQAKLLFNFDTNYESKKITSEDSDAIEGLASSKAENNQYRIEIKKLATKLTIGSKKIKLNKKIPQGSISIEGKQKKFKGGSLNKFKNFLNENYSEFLSAKKIKISSEIEQLIIESKKEGIKGILKIKDPDQILKNLSIFDKNQHLTKGKQAKKIDSNPITQPKEMFSPIFFEAMQMKVISNGPSEISSNRKALSLSKKAAKELLTSPPYKKNARVKSLNLSIDHQPLPKLKKDLAPTQFNFGPTHIINIKEIKLNTYNLNRKRKIDKPIVKEVDYGIILKSNKETAEKISLKGKGRFQQIPVHDEIYAIEFYTHNTKISFIDPTWAYDIEVPKSLENKKNSNKNDDDITLNQKKTFPNLIKPAQDAKIKIDGVEVERAKNKDINDIIDGVQLNLFKKTDGPVKVSIVTDHNDIKQKIILFVEAYNKLLEFTQENSQTDELIKEVGKFDKMAKLKGKTGVFMTNLAVRNLINGLKRRVSNPYPTFRKPKIKISATLGISTGKIGANWQEISKGYLQIDQDLLVKRLIENPLAVKDFFGSDTNQDLKIDNGLAFKLYEFLKPYTQNYGRGILYSNIANNKERIRQLDKRILKVKEKADRYENQLKRKFGSMEAVIQRQKTIGKQIQNRFKISDK